MLNSPFTIFVKSFYETEGARVLWKTSCVRFYFKDGKSNHYYIRGIRKALFTIQEFQYKDLHPVIYSIYELATISSTVKCFSREKSIKPLTGLWYAFDQFGAHSDKDQYIEPKKKSTGTSKI